LPLKPAGSMPPWPTSLRPSGSATEKPSRWREGDWSVGLGPGALAGKRWPVCLATSGGKEVRGLNIPKVVHIWYSCIHIHTRASSLPLERHFVFRVWATFPFGPWTVAWKPAAVEYCLLGLGLLVPLEVLSCLGFVGLDLVLPDPLLLSQVTLEAVRLQSFRWGQPSSPQQSQGGQRTLRSCQGRYLYPGRWGQHRSLS
jgi:hypothetical protein